MLINPSVFERALRDHLMITGGHFMILENGQPNLNQGTIDSFQAAVSAYISAKERGHDVALGILINDMGGVCDTKKQICALDPERSRKAFRLPGPYLEFLERNGINPETVKVYWEKSLRNRGKKELLKQLKRESSPIEHKEGAYWFVNPKDGRRITLSRQNPNDKYGIAACPLIMAAFARQMKDGGYLVSLNFYYVDIENEENIPNYFAIEKGRAVAENWYEGIDITNVYMLKDRIMTSADFGKA